MSSNSASVVGTPGGQLAERRVVEDDVGRDAPGAGELQAELAEPAEQRLIHRSAGVAVDAPFPALRRLMRLPIEHALGTPAQQVGARAA